VTGRRRSLKWNGHARCCAICGLQRFYPLPALQFAYPTEARGLQSLGVSGRMRGCPASVRWVGQIYGGCGRIYRQFASVGDDVWLEFHYDLEGAGAGVCGGPTAGWPGQMSPVIAALRTGFAAEATARWAVADVRSKRGANWRADPSDGLRPMAGERNRSARGHQQMSTVGGDSGEDGSTRFPGKVPADWWKSHFAPHLWRRLKWCRRLIRDCRWRSGLRGSTALRTFLPGNSAFSFLEAAEG